MVSLLFQVCIPTNLNMEANYLAWRRLVPEWHLLLSITQAVFQLWAGSPSDGSFGILIYQSMSTVLHLGKSTASASLGVECFQSSLDISSELCIISSCISSPSSVQVSSRTCHKLIQTSNSNYTLLDGGSLATHSPQHVK